MPSVLKSISVIVPAFNAEAVIASTLDAILAFCRAEMLDFEVIVVDDASTDSTGEIVRSRFEGVQLITHPTNMGKGAAVRTGMLRAKADWAVFLDADHSTHIDHLRLVSDLAGSADVLVGSRRVAHSNSNIARPLHRRLLGDLFPTFTARVLPNMSDTQCGFKVFKRWTVQPIFSALTVRRFAFDVEALLLATRLGATIREFPVQWNNPAESTLRVQRDAPQMLLDLARVAWALRAGGSKARQLAKLGAELRAQNAEQPRVVIGPEIAARFGTKGQPQGPDVVVSTSVAGLQSSSPPTRG